jgi:hypothetical protein
LATANLFGVELDAVALVGSIIHLKKIVGWVKERSDEPTSSMGIASLHPSYG